MISKAKWQKYVDRLAAIDDRAAAEMERYIDANGLIDDKALIDYAYALATKYGEASAELACEMYDLMAQTQGANVPPAVPAETATIGEVAKNVRWAKYHSPGQIPSKVGRFVRQAGADTILQNAERDGVQWAWVPSGGETCAFCIALASRGWQDASDAVKRGRHASHIHANCDCTFAIAHNEKAKRDYDYIYDPDRYKEMYYGAEGNTPAEKINSLRRIRYQENREYINAQKRDAYQARKLEQIASGKVEEETATKDVDFFVGPGTTKKIGTAVPAEYAGWIGENKMDYYLNLVISESARRVIISDFRRTSVIGDGDTYSIRLFEKTTGINCGRNGNTHSQKVNDLIRQIEKALLSDIPESDKVILEQRLEKLKKVKD